MDKRTGGALKATVYPGSSLMKTNAQFAALRKGALVWLRSREREGRHQVVLHAAMSPELL